MRLRALLAINLIAAGLLASSARAATLPIPPVVDGVQVATQADDFLSYSLPLLDSIQSQQPSLLPPAQFGDLQSLTFGSGTGNLDVIVYTGANGATNQNVLGDPSLDFANPLNSPGGNASTFSGTWNGASVGTVLDYLHQFDPQNNTPVFVFNKNQTGASPEIFSTSQVRLVDGSNNTVASWAYDNLTNATFDPLAWVEIGPQPNVTGTSGTTYNPNASQGSGTADVARFAPTMDLSQYGRDLQLVVDFNLSGLNGGFEELFLSGRLSPQRSAVIPEPISLTLWSALALFGLGVRRRFGS